jgi:hypothetical protein
MMSLLRYWKIGAAAALLAGMVTASLPLGSAVAIHDLLAGQPALSVTLQGRIEVLRPNWFLLRDATGAIVLETCPTWYRRLPLRPGERISVQGELAPRGCWRMGQPLFMVQRLRREDGTQIALRFGPGPPPWGREIWRAELAYDDLESALND